MGNRGRWVIGFGVIFGLIFFKAQAQIPCQKGESQASLGHFSHDPSRLADRSPKRYLYLLEPFGADEIWLDFSIQTHSVNPGEEKSDFIRVFQGKDTLGTLVATLGPRSGNQWIRIYDSALTFVFDRKSQESFSDSWTAIWRGITRQESWQSGAPDPACPEVLQICGPTFEEGDHWPLQDLSSWIPPTDPRPFPSKGKIFQCLIQSDGPLEFGIRAGSPLQNVDWALWVLHSNQSSLCPSHLGKIPEPHASNQSNGAGVHWETGMDRRGSKRWEFSGGNPYCQPIQVKKGDRVILLVGFSSTQEPTGLSLRLGPTVFKCENPKVEIVPFCPPLPKPELNNLQPFTSQSLIFRIYLEGEGNTALAECAPLETSGPNGWMKGLSGLVPALLRGVQNGKIPLFSANPPHIPLSYGDLLDLGERKIGTELPAGENPLFEPPVDWWEQGPEVLRPLESILELIQVERFDQTKGMKLRQTLWIRLVWHDPEGFISDQNVGIIPYSSLAPLLGNLMAPDPRNESIRLSIQQLLDAQQFSGIRIYARSQRKENAPKTQNLWEFEDYLWAQ